jgi:hypothetical protein
MITIYQESAKPEANRHRTGIVIAPIPYLSSLWSQVPGRLTTPALGARRGMTISKSRSCPSPGSCHKEERDRQYDTISTFAVLDALHATAACCTGTTSPQCRIHCLAGGYAHRSGSIFLTLHTVPHKAVPAGSRGHRRE